MTTGQRIKAARKKAGLTQKELGERMGQSFQSIAQWENDLRKPKLETLQRIAAALGTSISNLLPPDNYWEDEDGIGYTEPQVVEHEGPLQRAEVVERSATPEELEALLAKLQDGKPLLLSPDELAKLKSTPKEQVAAALDEVGQEEQKHIVRISAPLYKLRGVSPEQRERLKELKDQAVRYEHSLGITGLGKSTMINALLAKDPQRRIVAALGKLNEEGQEKAAERVEELTEIPRYQAQEPPTAPAQDTPAPQEGTDTTLPSEASQEPPEGRIQSITMLCPICGQHLIGNSVTGKAYCNYCKRSFPLPQILK